MENNISLTRKEVIEIVQTIFVQNFPKLQEFARLEAEKNKDKFLMELDIKISERLTEEEISKFKQPTIQLALKEAVIAASCKDDEAERTILSNLIIRRIKTDDDDLSRIIYDEAIKNIPRLTKKNIYLLTLIETITCVNYSLLQDEDNDIDLSKFIKYIETENIISKIDIEHCKSFGLISSIFPYEWDIEYMNMDAYKGDLLELIQLTRYILEKLKLLNLEKFEISPVGRAIARENILNLFDRNKIEFKNISQKLSDLRVKNLMAEGEVSAFDSGIK
jgi:hypothetical protein